eukprot:CAMPEP_0183340136 /NCGR_PEP_ID=MMETSP0164_2-20130417/6797_1 /TAXON_ID=221442 /ORGANISM="Coccolithus pelagicus ssp braarudi, Strain PLY182g" /LENGTH=60 /DNA_ID=CAMNT_0025510229 /DNA_START=234 /DNA_END=416 /DNA_ORIENTATION=-
MTTMRRDAPEAVEALRRLATPRRAHSRRGTAGRVSRPRTSSDAFRRIVQNWQDGRAEPLN